MAEHEELTYKDVLSKAVDLLARREHRIKELEIKLSAKKYSEHFITQVIFKLLENDLLSEERFTESYIRSRQNRGFGPQKIKIELRHKGIDDVLIERYLMETSMLWYEIAENEYNKKYREQPANDYNTWAKQAKFLQSRGFTNNHIYHVLGELTNID